MRYLHTVFTILLFIFSLFFSFWINVTFANNYLVQINKDSNSEKIKRLQEVFKWLSIYAWEIDGNFDSIRDSLVNYQVENNIISDPNHNEAWYFWNKTIKSLQSKFWQKFLDLREEFLKFEPPKINQEWSFVVTAYYSPIEWQKKYTTWSYESEIKLNGWWNTASWKKPYAWVIAAPRNYSFWTKIFLEWFWVWVVEDRWWAIVNSWDKWFLHDRIDVWMGYGDEWRIRTKDWGVKTIKGSIVDAWTPLKVFFDEESKEQNIERQNNNNFDNIFISPENPDFEEVKKAQELLKKIWLYSWEIDWNYSQIKEILINFQLENNIIDNKNSFEAGYFWKKTINSLKNIYWENFDKTPEKKEILEEKKNEFVLNDEEKSRLENIKNAFLKRIIEKNDWDEIKANENIKNIKTKMKEILENYSWRKKELLNYFIEIL